MKPLGDEYLWMLEQMRTIDSSRQMQSGWANRKWVRVIASCFNQLSDSQTLGHLRLLAPHVDTDHDAEDSIQFFDLVAAVASQRAWSMSFHSEVPPHQWLGLLDTNSTWAREAKTKMQDDCELIKRVNDYIANGGSDRVREVGGGMVLETC